MENLTGTSSMKIGRDEFVVRYLRILGSRLHEGYIIGNKNAKYNLETN